MDFIYCFKARLYSRNDSKQTAINFLLKQKKKDKNIALNLQEKKYNKIKEEFKYKLIT